MKQFLSEDFLLDTKTAHNLYYDVASKQPIIDWHCHILPGEIEQNRRYDNLTQMWLEADHYKWRAMRLAGIDEKYITGDADDREKYDAWVKTLSRCIGNPLYHWTHLELARCFGITEPLNEKTADRIWEKSKQVLASPDFGVRKLIEKFNVDTIFTTDDPSDSLDSHQKLRQDSSFHTKVLPAFRPDKALNIDLPDFPLYIKKLGKAADISIKNIDNLKQALHNRMDAFALQGCRAADQSFTRFPYLPAKTSEIESIFHEALSGKSPSSYDAEKYRTAILRFVAEEYAGRGWLMELHIGAMRNNNTMMYNLIGADTGYDSICDEAVAEKLSRFLDSLAVCSKLPKTVLFTLNPKDNMVLGAMAGNFAEKTGGKIQLGTAWWFNDNKDGMEEQIKCYGNLGVLSNFIGMVTDSRSFLSYPRHEYFRRILCNVIGNWVEKGEFPEDYDVLTEIVEGICYKNAIRHFGLS